VPDFSEEVTNPDLQVLPLYGEDTVITRRTLEKARVRASRTTHIREKVVEEQITHELVEVHRVPMNVTVATVPPTRQEGDTTIMSVVEEVVFVERRLVLKEEVHLRRVRKVERFVETVALREQIAVVTRTEISGGDGIKDPE
jgi:stress response protein YsnF